ncbi:acetylcholinesterase-1-like isoform X2 [Varroa destructor]|uniref:Carboxylesterase type B domain-containing protein n=1 Tax=Varroa destructor TaxID=109461 RepID=A0A7M7KL28_VARDE|nr:acetylcholinesterase-1-like isoform X2 [Varroa destructor]
MHWTIVLVATACVHISLAGAPIIRKAWHYDKAARIKAREQRELPHTFVKAGLLRGLRGQANSRPVDIYFGIPYAVPPIGALRFKQPVPVKKWKGVLDATRPGSPCSQRDLHVSHHYSRDAANSSEDCLHLNVFTAARYCFSQNLLHCGAKPVMVFLHGGGFQNGANTDFVYDSRFLAVMGDVVVVIPNYRLNVFGFLNGNVTGEVPGNMGLYDQMLALEWVQKNIASFGGDPRRITVFGHGAGAVSIGYHLLSPLSKGLFKRAILQSGSPYSKLPDNTFTGKMKVQQLALELGCDKYIVRGQVLAYPREVLKCLRKVPVSTLYAASAKLFGPEDNTMIPSYFNEFLPREPIVAAELDGYETDVEVLLGTVRDEGTLPVNQFFWKMFGLDSFFGVPVSDIWFYASLFFQSVLGRSVEAVRGAYSSENATTREAVEALASAVGDFVVVCPSVYFADTYSRRGNKVWLYQFAHRPSFSASPLWTGVAHGEDVSFGLGYPLLYPKISTEDEKLLARRMIRIYAHFAHTGHHCIAALLIQYNGEYTRTDQSPVMRKRNKRLEAYGILQGKLPPHTTVN